MTQDGFWELGEVLHFHSAQLKLFGGREGILNRDALLSALNAPITAYSYGVTDIVELAVIYLSRISGNHSFADGNKRTAAVCMVNFLEYHGIRVLLSNAELEKLVIDVVTHVLDEPSAGEFLRLHVAELPD